MCGQGQSPTISTPCDPGVVALDSEDGTSLQGSVLLCPPPGCQSNGCSGNHIGEKDIPACGVDTSNSTAIGSTFLVTFVVFDSSGLNASVSRAVTVVSPCDPGYQLCSDGQCHSTDCATVDTLQVGS